MNVVKAKFPGSNRPIEFQAGGLEIKTNETIVVEDELGPKLAKACEDAVPLDEETGSPIPRVMRVATKEDLANQKKFREQEEDAFRTAKRLSRERRLPMKMIGSEYLFDGSKLIFYFTAESRVDFRDLVRELAQIYKTRIEMKQIGVRDAAKMIGGVDVCGRELCCTMFLGGFSPVSIKQAKDQNLSLNPSKLSGVCGRLKCCLVFEHEIYADYLRGKPKVGKRAETPDGMGRVRRHDPLNDQTVVMLEDGREVIVLGADIKRAAPPNAKKKDGAEADASSDDKSRGRDKDRDRGRDRNRDLDREREQRAEASEDETLEELDD
ncbi:hypothetical protein KDL45_11480, partial [bacterium]|nr:hypothetical protein [bacterium]